MANEIASAYVSLVVSARGIQGQLRGIVGQTGGAGSQAGESFGKRFAAGAGAAVKTGIAAVVAGAAGIAVAGIKGAAALEQTTVAFTSLLGSSKAATDQIKALQQFAAQTPFSQQDVFGYAQQYFALADSVGLAKDQVQPFLTAIGDIAAVTGASTANIHDAVLAIGQMGSSGKITLENLNQVSEAFPGFNAAAAIAAATGKTTAQTMDAISKGSIDAKTGVQALIQGMRQFQGASGAMAAQAQTLSGLFSTFKDTISISLTQAFQPIIPVIKDTLAQLTPVIQQVTQAIAPVIGGIIKALGPELGPLLQNLGSLFAEVLKAIAPLIPALVKLVNELLPALVKVLKVITPLIDLLAKAIEGWATAIHMISDGISAVFGSGGILSNAIGEFTGLQETIESGLHTDQAIADVQNLGSALGEMLGVAGGVGSALADRLNAAAAAATGLGNALGYALASANSLGVLGAQFGFGGHNQDPQSSPAPGGLGALGGQFSPGPPKTPKTPKTPAQKPPFDKSTLTALFQTATGAQTNPLTTALNAILQSAKSAGTPFTSRAVKILRRENRDLIGLVKQRDTVTNQLAAAQQRLADVTSRRADEIRTVRDTVKGTFDIASSGTGFDGQQPVTFNRILAQVKQAVTRATRFTTLLKKLAREGLARPLLQQLAEAGPQALPQAIALSQATPKQLAKLNAQYKALGTQGQALGTFIGNDLYKAGVDSAQGLVDGLKSKQSTLNKTIRALASGMVKSLRDALGIKSPSTVMRLAGGFAGEGFRLGIADKHGDVAREAQRLANNAVPRSQAAAWAAGGQTVQLVLTNGEVLGEVVLTRNNLTRGQVPVHIATAAATGQIRNGRR